MENRHFSRLFFEKRDFITRGAYYKCDCGVAGNPVGKILFAARGEQISQSKLYPLRRK